MDLENLFVSLELEDPGIKNKCSVISEGIQSGQYTIITILEQLGSLLANPTTEKRQLGVLILTEVLEGLPNNFLNPQQCEVILNFYLNKLKDRHQLVPIALRGILILIDSNQFPKEQVPLMLTTLFQNVACQQQQQADRYTIYSIFKALLEKFPTELVSMGSDLVFGILSAIDGERDPKNLLFIFQWMVSFLQLVPLGHLEEEMFETLACYFPVDYKVQPAVSLITREELADGLCSCLTAVPEFGQLCIDLALEKLDSSLEIAKNDSLRLLEAGCSTFLCTSYMKLSYQIWSQIQKEIFTSSGPIEENKYLSTLTKIINKFSESPDTDFQAFLHNTVDMLKGNLLPDTKHFKHSCMMLVHIAQGSEYSSNYVVETIVPLLANTYNMSGTMVHRIYILHIIGRIAEAYLKHHQNCDFTKGEMSTILSLCFQATSDLDEDMRMEGFYSVSNIAIYLPKNIREIFYNHMKVFIVEIVPENVRKSIIHCFQALASSYTYEVQSNIIAKMHIQNIVYLDLYLSALCELAHLKLFIDVITDCLIEYVQKNFEWSTVALKNIKLLLENNPDNLEIREKFLEKNIIDIMIEFSNSYILVNKDTSVLFTNISSVLRLVIGSQTTENQMKAVKHVDKVFRRTVKQEDYLLILSGLITRLHQGIEVKYEIVKKLFRIARSTEKEFVFEAAVQLLANVINKKADDELLLGFLQDLKSDCLHLLRKNEHKAIFILSWIAKALIMRNHPQGLAWIDLLLEMANKHSEVTEGFRIIMDDSYESLSLASHSIKTLLYKQKVFMYVTDRFMKEFPEVQPSSTIILGHLLNYAPESVILLHFKKISRLIMLCLEKSEDFKVLLVLLKIIKNLSVLKNETVEESLEDFLTRILNLLSFNRSMNVRIEAIRCLVQFCSGYPVYKLLPFKSAVLSQLALCTDDNKRLVRKEAMEARSLWFLLDAPI